MSPDRVSPSSLDGPFINLIIKWESVVRKSQSVGQRKLYEPGRQRKSTEALCRMDKKTPCEVRNLKPCSEQGTEVHRDRQGIPVCIVERSVKMVGWKVRDPWMVEDGIYSNRYDEHRSTASRGKSKSRNKST